MWWQLRFRIVEARSSLWLAAVHFFLPGEHEYL